MIITRDNISGAQENKTREEGQNLLSCVAITATFFCMCLYQLGTKATDRARWISLLPHRDGYLILANRLRKTYNSKGRKKKKDEIMK